MRKPESVSLVLRQFLDEQLQLSRPVALALSGGTDSLALFQLLVEERKRSGLDVHVVHVDHGWRHASAAEASSLRDQVMSLGIPFHLKRLDMDLASGNLEAEARQERLSFFEKIFQQIGAQAVILGHHADDQAETVLRATLQGGALPTLRGMSPVTQMRGMTLWRPLLSVSRTVLADYLASRGIEPFEDPSNGDPRFLRCRLRSTVLPFLSENFGKEVREPLCRLGRAASEFHDYLDAQVAETFSLLKRSPLGLYLPVSGAANYHIAELRHLVRRFLEMAGIIFPQVLVDETCQLLQKRASGKTVRCRSGAIVVDREQLFLPAKALGTPEKLWQLHTEELRCRPGNTVGDWQALWSGACYVDLPENNYHLGTIASADPSFQKRLRKRWSDHKVPSFLRSAVPVLWLGDRIVHEFLTGQRHYHSKIPETNALTMRIQLQAINHSLDGVLV